MQCSAKWRTMCLGQVREYDHFVCAAVAWAQLPEPNCNSNRYEGNEVWSGIPNFIGAGAGDFWWVETWWCCRPVLKLAVAGLHPSAAPNAL